MATVHSRLSASNAYRWMNCPASVEIIAAIGDKSGFHAQRGTAAHLLGEVCLDGGAALNTENFLGAHIAVKEGEGNDPFLVDATLKGPALKKRIKSLEEEGWSLFEVDREMAEAVQVYVDFIADLREELRPNYEAGETRLLLPHLHDDLGGSPDRLLAVDFDVLHVIDYKHGYTIVEAEDNEQGLIYLLGALYKIYGGIKGVDRVDFTIVQPRAQHADGPVRTVSYTIDQLKAFEAELKRAADEVKPNAPLRAGSWCKYCPVAENAPGCVELTDSISREAALDFDDPPEEIDMPQDGESVARLMKHLPMIEAWIKGLEGMARRELEAGRKVPGYKLVRKKSSGRKWLGDEKPTAKELLKRAKREKLPLKEADLFTAPELKSPAQVEKLGKKAVMKALIDGLTVSPPGGITVAPETDPRAEVDWKEAFEEASKGTEDGGE